MSGQASLLLRNTVLNFFGQVLVGLIAVITMPFVIHGLGTDGFGILSLVWVVLGYSSLFDLGLGRATTKFIADSIGRGDLKRIPTLIWTSLGFQLFLGIMGAIVLAAAIPFLVANLFNIPPAMVGEASSAFFFVAASLPIVLGTAALRGVLEAAQRFDLINLVKVPLNASTFLAPAIALAFRFRLPEMVLLLALARLGAAVAYLMFCLKVFPILKQDLSFDPKILRPMMFYGGWITVSGVVSPLLVYLDRILIGSLVSVAAVAYYSAPYELVAAFWILPGSLVGTLFPAFCTLAASGAREELGQLYGRSLKPLLLTVGPLLLLVVFFAEEILQLWLGGDFAEKSSVVLQILAMGVLVNSLAFVPFSLLQGFGRPDLTAKFHLLELPVYAAVAPLLVTLLGITGAALAWSLRVWLDAALLFGACMVLQFAPFRLVIENGLLQTVLAVCGLGILLALPLLAGETIMPKVFWASLLAAAFSFVAWRYALDAADRAFLTSGLAGAVHKLTRSTR